MSFLENQGEDLSLLLDTIELPEEFLRDPSHWMRAPEMEAFLQHAQQLSARYIDGPLFQKVAHAGPELRSWGVLDSVLRMMPRPQEILAQPERLLAYFISPAPPIDNVNRSENSIEFDMPISADQYPLATAYLAASFESIPLYVGQASASCEWRGIHVRIRWSTDQKNFFEGVDLGHSLSPDLMRNVVATLEKHSKDLEAKNRELTAMLQAQRQMSDAAHNQGHFVAQGFAENPGDTHLSEPIEVLCKEELQQNLSRLGDYMVRAQQLITMLVAQGRQSPQVKEAMRRVDWERVQKQFPITIEECRQMISGHSVKTKNTLENTTGELPHV